MRSTIDSANTPRDSPAAPAPPPRSPHRAGRAFGSGSVVPSTATSHPDLRSPCPLPICPPPPPPPPPPLTAAPWPPLCRSRGRCLFYDDHCLSSDQTIFRTCIPNITHPCISPSSAAVPPSSPTRRWRGRHAQPMSCLPWLARRGRWVLAGAGVVWHLCDDE